MTGHLLDENTVEIPDDGKEHACACGDGDYYVWDGDGWSRELLIVDANSDGRTKSTCRRCDRELKPGGRT